MSKKAKGHFDLKQYVTVGEAAEYLGVSASTLRNWDRDGKLKPYRNPLNGYRLYKKAELDKVLKRVKKG